MRAALFVAAAAVGVQALAGCPRLLPPVPVEGEAEGEGPARVLTTLTTSGTAPQPDDTFGAVLASARVDGTPTVFAADTDTGALLVHADPFGAQPVTTTIAATIADAGLAGFVGRGAAADLDGDGDVDLAVRGANALSVLEADGATYRPATAAGDDVTASNEGPLALFDVDGDGHLDVVAAGLNGDTYVVTLAGGVATAARQTLRPLVGDLVYCGTGFAVVAGALVMPAEVCGRTGSTSGNAEGPDRLFVVDVEAGQLVAKASVDLGGFLARTVYARDHVVEVGLQSSTVQAVFDGSSFGASGTSVGAFSWGFGDVDGDGNAGFIVEGEAPGAEVRIPGPAENAVVATSTATAASTSCRPSSSEGIIL